LIGVRSASALLKPGFNLGKIPDDATLGNEEATWKFPALLQFVDCRICQWNELMQLWTPDCPRGRQQ